MNHDTTATTTVHTQRAIEDEEGEEYKVELLPGLTDAEIDELAKQLPTKRIPAEIKELLQFARGFEFSGMEEVRFDTVSQADWIELSPFAMDIANDGFGNYWTLEVASDGKWGNVYFICHDPAVIVKQSDDLAGFIQDVHEMGKDPERSILNTIHDKIAGDIWRSNVGFTERQALLTSGDEVLREFAALLPENYVVADLRNKPIGSGFAWGRFGASCKVVRHPSGLPVWGVEKKEKRGFFSRLFGK